VQGERNAKGNSFPFHCRTAAYLRFYVANVTILAERPKGERSLSICHFVGPAKAVLFCLFRIAVTPIPQCSYGVIALPLRQSHSIISLQKAMIGFGSAMKENRDFLCIALTLHYLCTCFANNRRRN